METIDHKSLEFALSKIKDGFIFENFANQFLSQVLGYEFIPAGGIKDRGIDGLQNIFNQKGYDSYIYQASIEKDCPGKIESSLKKLKNNNVKFEKFYFVTNQEFKKKELTIDKLFNEYKIPITIFDIKWFSSNVNSSAGTINVYNRFIKDCLHEYSQPGKAYAINDFISDPRLFVFLNQQWDINRGNLDLHAILADTLILFCLEETDPDKNILKTKDELKNDISKLIKFDFKILMPIIDERLYSLSRKPRQINYHSNENAYCLPYETRKKICEKNLQDLFLYNQFKSQTEKDFASFLKVSDSTLKNGFSFIEKVLNKIFYQQGLEFSDFVIHGENKDAIEKNMFEIISSVVDDSSGSSEYKASVKEAIILTIRNMVYSGTIEQNQFLKKLSNTYMMMFMLQCEPSLYNYFHTMASKLNIYVCTSIIIPALSEFYLPELNRRHWNLLTGARDAGVTLIINEPILSELASHFRSFIKRYYEQYEDIEDVFLNSEEEIQYIDGIMIRAYFYAKSQGKVKNFQKFIDTFINPTLKNIESEIQVWLRDAFDIKFKSDASSFITIDDDDFTSLYEALKKQKPFDAQAKTDSKIILTIQKIREINNETESSGIFGYKTWWLSKDTVTQRVVNSIFRDKYKVSCYMRPDFLYAYISLAPTKSQIDSAYSQLFPTMLGVNISYHLDPAVTKTVHDLIIEHKDKNHSRLASILHTLTEQLKTEPNKISREFIKNHFDSSLNK